MDSPGSSLRGAVAGVALTDTARGDQAPQQTAHSDITTGDGQPAPQDETNHPDIQRWIQEVTEKYPRLSTESYFVPSVFMYQRKYVSDKTTGRTITKVEAPDRSHSKDDEANYRARLCFQELSKTDRMFVLSELNFPDLLKRMPLYPRKKAKLNLPRPCDQEMKDKGWNKGDFDILVIHPRFGMLAAELKSVGYEFQNQDYNDGIIQAVNKKLAGTEGDKENTKKEGTPAIPQMEKARGVLNHVLSNLQPVCRVTTSLIMPFMSRSQLRLVLDNHRDTEKKLRKALDVEEGHDVTDYCFLSDDMPKPEEDDDVKRIALRQRWERVMSGRGPDPNMTESRYISLVARFCGPATEVTLRTLVEGVSHMGEEFLRVCLTPEQVDIVKEDPPFLCLVGPPGTGKSTVLLQKVREWLEDKLDVHIVSLYKHGMAAAELIYADLIADHPTRDRVVHIHHVPIHGSQAILQKLEPAGQHGRIAVVMDEAADIPNSPQSREASGMFEQFIHELVDTELVEKLWALSMYDVDVNHTRFEQQHLTTAMRVPPEVKQEVQERGMGDNRIRDYSTGEVPPAGEGVAVMALHHLPDNQGDHSGDRPDQCQKCGMALGKLLLSLNVAGQSQETEQAERRGSKESTPKEGKHRQKEGKDKTKTSALQFKDVFILSHDGFPDGATRDLEGGRDIPSSPFLQGLVGAGIPVSVVSVDRVIQTKDCEPLARIVRPDRPNEVIAADIYTVKGLKRKVVAWVQGLVSGEDARFQLDRSRLYGMSRCVSQLVCVCSPETAREAGWMEANSAD